MHKEDVFDLLDYTEKQIINLKENSKFSKVDVKNILENLRSTLEYCAQFINYKLSLNKNGINFPYGENEQKFKIQLIKNLGNLQKISPKLYCLIESLQPHKSNNNWLVVMCKATNEVKHRKSLNIKEENYDKKKITHLEIPGVNLGQFWIDQINANKFKIEFTNMSFNNLPMDDFIINDGEIVTKREGVISPFFTFEIVNNKIFILEDYSYDLIELLDTSYMNVNNFSITLFHETF